MLRGGEPTPELPINAWLIDHEESPILLDSGDLEGTGDRPFARSPVAVGAVASGAWAAVAARGAAAL